jgi:N6-L-threonylcarbamoyladenine synthase
LQKHPEVLATGAKICDLCASVQAAIVETLVGKTVRAALRLGVHCVTASGGVTCNRGLRHELTRRCEQEGLTLRLAEPAWCTDNAGMIGILAERRLIRNSAGVDPDGEMNPSWSLA